MAIIIKNGATITKGIAKNKELTEEKGRAGAIIESVNMTMISTAEFLTNFPSSFKNDKKIEQKTPTYGNDYLRWPYSTLISKWG